jgi:hypothetical protein
MCNSNTTKRLLTQGITMQTAEKTVATQAIAIEAIDNHTKRITQALAVLGLLEEKLLDIAEDGRGLSGVALQHASESIWAAKDLIRMAKI